MQVNSRIIMDKCCFLVVVIKLKKLYHIKERCNADSNNNVDGIHMNKKSNLIPLYKSCHNKTTNGNLIINGYKESSNGLLLDIKFFSRKLLILKKKKFNEDQITKIKEYSKKIYQKNYYDFTFNRRY